MTVSPGITNRTNLNAENGNLIAAIVADPNLLKTVLNEIYDYIDANWGDYNTHKTSAVLGHPDGSVTTAKIALAAITNALIAVNAVSSANIQVGAVNNTHLASNSVGNTQMQVGAIGNAQLQTNSVATTNLQDASVTAAKIDPAIMNSNIDLNTHRLNTTLDHPDGSVKTAKIADQNVTTAKIADQNITTAKLSDGNVTRTKLAPGLISLFVSGV